MYKKLHEICDIQIGKKINKYEYDFNGGNYQLVTETDILNNYRIYDTLFSISDDLIKKYNFMQIPENTVLFSCNLSISKIAISKNPLYTNDKVAALIIKNKELLTEYLYYVLCFYNKPIINSLIYNFKDNLLDVEKLSKIKIPIVPIEKQKRICSFIDNMYQMNYLQNIKIIIDYYADFDIFEILLNEDYELYKCLDIVQKFNIKIFKLTDIIIIKDELLNLQKIKNDIMIKINDNNPK